MTKRIQNIFAEVPQTYALVNHVLTLGLDILWRKGAARMAAEPGGDRWLDVCTGTGEMAAYLSRLAEAGTTVTAVDITLPMLRTAIGKPEGRSIAFVQSNVMVLPFPDGVFDLLTSSVATRNLNLTRQRLVQTFGEFHRVLKTGGRFVNLETSQPGSAFIKRAFHLYIRLLVKQLGSRISGSASGYAYLAHTIPRFYTAEELLGIMKQAGFRGVVAKKLFPGIAAVHAGLKE